jgi:arylsulfatase A-like enzyme/Tfp pilus assembly protein PilF
VLLVTIDTLRADRLGCYGFGLAHTPAIDQLAAEGVRCTDAATVAPITLPAHGSIMTGLYPPAHGVRDNGNYALGDEALTLAERLQAEGYRTAAFVSAVVLARRFRLDQGFEVYDDQLWEEDEPPLFMIRDRPARRTADRVLAWLEQWRRNERPFFLWVHFFDPHHPHEVDAVDLAALTPTPYDAEVAEADRGVGRILDWLRAKRVLDDTLVVLTADHGESLGEHGEPTHGIFIYDATIRVPLIWRLPRMLPAGRTYDGAARAIDIMATTLAVLGLPGGEATQGMNLLPAFQGRVSPPDLAQYAEARLAEEGFGMAPLTGLRHAGLKWIRAPRPELYDLRGDPRERTNIEPSRGDAARVLDAELDAVLADCERRALAAPRHAIDRETEEMLRALGYLAAPEQRAEMAGMDPKDGIALYAKLDDARHRAQLGDWRGAETLLREILADAPANVTARNVLALTAVRQGNLAEAEHQYEASLAAQPRQHRVRGALGALALQQERLDEAERHYREALVLAPTFVEGMANLGFIELVRGNDAGAQVWYEQALAADPTSPHVNRQLADLFYDRRDYTRALAYYRRALANLPRHFAVLIQAGNSARLAGDSATAAGYYTDAQGVRPDSWIPPYNLACLRALAGDPGSLALLREALRLGFANPRLLEENEDFDRLRDLADYGVVLAEARAAAARHAESSRLTHTEVGDIGGDLR